MVCQLRSFASFRMTTSCLQLGLGFCGRHGKGSFRAADIFEPVVSSYRNGVFPRCQGGQAEVVVLDERVADTSARSHKNPIAAVQAVLRTLDRRRSVARGEVFMMAATHFSGGRTYLDVFYHWRRIVDLEALAFALGL